MDNFSSFLDESTQLVIFARFINSTTHAASRKLICVRKLGESKTAAAIRVKLEKMFAEKCINKNLIRFSGLYSTNAIDEQNGMQRKIQYVLPYAPYINCCNSIFVPCLVHLIKEYPEFQAVNKQPLSICKIFKYSSVKQTILENALTIEVLKNVKVLKA